MKICAVCGNNLKGKKVWAKHFNFVLGYCCGNEWFFTKTGEVARKDYSEINPPKGGTIHLRWKDGFCTWCGLFISEVGFATNDLSAVTCRRCYPDRWREKR